MTTLDQYRKQNGVVYTPRLLADHLAKKVLSFYFNDELKGNNYINNIEKIKIFDPACGNGELLAGIWRSLINSEKLISQITKNTFSPQDILFGVDIDYESTVVTQKLINSLIGPIPQVNKYNTYKTNALIPSNLHSVSDAWKQILFDFGVPNGFDIIIANPPWGADTTSYVNQINSSIYKLMQGQFDSSDLFIELSLQLLKPDGLIAFIIPDSLFARDKKALREYLLKNTEIQYIARLGEGFFQDIARGCVLLIAKNRIPTTTSVVECLRLDPKTRQLILNEQLSFEEADDRYSNKIAQSRFLQNPGYIFDIDVTSDEEDLISKLAIKNSIIDEFLFSYRGVELSKKGYVIQCNYCKNWMPLPRNNGHTCKKCGKEIDPAQKVTIVSSSPLPGYLPFIVGENISRFKIDSNLYIDPIKEGIRYKNLEQYTSEKIVIRKTGVGIMSSIDYSGALTNQVVYDFYLRGEYKYDGFLELINAILNSRPIYYLIVKRFGELEWRSHPYLTMNQIRELPLPLSNSSIKQLLSENRVTLLALRNTLRYHLEISEELDAEIERMVAKIYSLTKKDYQEIFATLTSIEQLRPVRLLLSIKPDDIFLNE